MPPGRLQRLPLYTSAAAMVTRRQTASESVQPSGTRPGGVTWVTGCREVPIRSFDMQCN